MNKLINKKMPQREPKLSYLSAEDRLKTYQLVVDGCHHLYSKNKFQEDKALPIITQLVKLGYNDPYFLAHLTSWAIRQDSKDLKIISVFANSLSSANGQPFSPHSKYKKPNLRYISAAAVQQLDPKLAWRITQFERFKFGIDKVLNEGRHFSNTLRTALKKYLKYRETQLELLRSTKKAGLGRMVVNMYKALHVAPSEATAAILRWKQKDKDIKFEKTSFDFAGMSPQEIAKKIRKEKLPVLSTIGALPGKMTPVVAVALLEQATGDQAVILRKVFEDAGVLSDKEVLELFNKKAGEAKQAVDRVKAFVHKTSADVKKGLKTAKAEVHKKATKGIGKVFIFLDLSPSMERAIEVAKEKGAVIAEMVDNPKENFGWGTFNERFEILPTPEEFVEDAFKAILFGKTCDGMTNAFLLYPHAREFGSEVDIIIGDGCQNIGDLGNEIRKYHESHPDIPKPKAMVWIKVFDPDGMGYSPSDENRMKDAYEANDIPTTILKPETLDNSALVTSAVKRAMEGPMSVINEIMETKLLSLPDWYFSI